MESTLPHCMGDVVTGGPCHFMDDRRLLQCVRKISHTSMHNMVCAQHLMYSEVDM